MKRRWVSSWWELRERAGLSSMRTGLGPSFYHWTWQRMRLARDRPVLGIAPAGRKTRFPQRSALRGGIGYPQDSLTQFRPFPWAFLFGRARRDRSESIHLIGWGGFRYLAKKR